MAHPLVDQWRPRSLPYLSPGASITTALAVTARELAAADSLPAVLERVIAVVPTLCATADRAAVVVASTDGFAPAAATDDRAQRFDQMQLQLGEGPTVQVLGGDGDAVLVDDVAREGRWPTWRAGLPTTRIGSCLALRLDAGRGTLGALTLYAGSPHAFTADTVAVGTAFALHTAAAMAAVTKRHNLRIALDSRDVIGQAKGILMERYRITADEAFDLLVAASQRGNRKLRDVAEELALTGELGVGRRTD